MDGDKALSLAGARTTLGTLTLRRVSGDIEVVARATASFAWAGRPLPFVPYRGMDEAIAALGRGERRALTPPHLVGRRVNPELAAASRIPVERFRAPMLIAGGDADETWPSGEMVRAIAERRSAEGRRTLALGFPGAGHNLSETGWSPINNDPGDRTIPATAPAQRTV